QGDFFQELLDGTFDHFGHDLGGLARLGGFLFRNRALGGDDIGGNTAGVQRFGFGGGNMHGNVFAGFFRTREIDQYTDFAAMHVARQLIGGFVAFETTHAHVLADLAHQRCASAFDSALTHGQLAQGGNVGRVLFGNQLGQLVDETNEIVIFGHEVGFAVDFNDSATLAVGSDMQADEA